MELSRFHPLKIALVMILLCLIMLPVSEAIVSFGQTMGAHRDTNETFALSGRLTGFTGAQELKDSSWNDQLRKIFCPNDKVYRVVIDKDGARYDFFAALPELPECLLGKEVILEYSLIRNIFGEVIRVKRSPSGFTLLSPPITPIYGKITRNACFNE